MKQLRYLMSGVALLALLVCSIAAQDMQKKPADTKAAKPAKAAAAAPKSDADIQKCIQDKVSTTPSMKDKPPSVSVSGGVATLTGEAKNGGTKGAATNIAKRCGAKSVTNNMTVAAAAKAAKPAADKKPADKKPAEKKM